MDTITEPRLRRIAASTAANRRSMLTGMQLDDWVHEISAILEGDNSAGSAQLSNSEPAAAHPPTGQPGPKHHVEHSQSAPDRAESEPPKQTNETDIDPHGFAAYEYGPADEPEPMRVSVTPGKSLSLFWSEPNDEAPVRIYRVVAADDEEPWSPESGRLVGITTGTELEDTEPFSGAVRYLQVWYNSGASVREAKASQPTCIAEKKVVSPVLDLNLREEAGTVTGEWEVFPRVTRVLVYRVPVELIRQGGQSPLYRIASDDDNLDGFRDHGAEPGRRYIYQVVAETHIGEEVHTSVPVSREQQISVVLERVRDLEVHFSEDSDDFFDLIWTPPTAGRVAVYRSEKRPMMGVEDEELSLDALAAADLLEENRLSPIKRNVRPGQDGIVRVPWPVKWSRAYFTPVTILNTRAVVGPTIAQTRVSSVQDAELIERVNEQLLTFSWPPGAAAVQIFQTRRHTDSSLIREDTRVGHEVSAEIWRDQGGYHFVPPLPRDGCAVHLCAVAYQEGRIYRSQFQTLDYGGLRIVRYAVKVKRGRVMLALSTETPSSMPPVQYALIVSRDRFPLDVRDGSPIELAPAGVDGAAGQATITPAWNGSEHAEGEWAGTLHLSPGRYFLRLFADLPTERLGRLALLDPPIGDLRVDIQ